MSGKVLKYAHEETLSTRELILFPVQPLLEIVICGQPMYDPKNNFYVTLTKNVSLAL